MNAREMIRQASVRDVLRGVLGMLLLPGYLIRADWLLAVAGVAFLGLRLSDQIVWPWIWVLAPFWGGAVLYLVKRGTYYLLEVSFGLERSRELRSLGNIFGREIVLSAVLPALKLGGVIGWSWWWVLSPVWMGIGLQIMAVAMFVALQSAFGSAATTRVLEKAIVGLTLVGVGGGVTAVLAALKVSGTIPWSWWVVVAPVAANLALWIIAYVIAFSFVACFGWFWNRSSR